MSGIRLTDLSRCLQGVIPSVIATADTDGVPNVIYVSQIHPIDDTHVALSRQFFNKTSRNLETTRRACAEVYDPVTMQAYRLRMRFLRSERSGPLFEQMSARIQAIASMTGMDGIFRLIGADVFHVERIEAVEGFLSDPPESSADEEVGLSGFRSELRGLQLISERINRSADLDELLDVVLQSLEEYFGFQHTMILLAEGNVLLTVAKRGYEAEGIGAEVAPGEGLIGTAVTGHKPLRMTGLEAGIRYGRAVRRSVEQTGDALAPEIPLPGLPDARSALVIPLWVGDRLVGALAAESRDSLGFGEWHEAYLEIIGNQIALGIERSLQSDSRTADETRLPIRTPRPSASPARRLTYYVDDECVFLDDEYLIRNVPAKILWKLLREWKSEGRVEFSNRELRLDPALGLPEIKDNLETRLILLRKRLDEKSAAVRLVPCGRGRFSLQVDSDLELIEK